MELLKALKDITAQQEVKIEAMTAKINELEEVIKKYEDEAMMHRSFIITTEDAVQRRALEFRYRWARPV